MGCPRCHGDAAPPRGLGRELAVPSGCALRLRSDRAPGPGGGVAPRPGRTLRRVPLTRGPRRRERLTPTRGHGRVGWARPLRSRRGREPSAGSLQPQGRQSGRRAAGEEGRRRGRGRSWREEAGNSPPAREEPAHRTQPWPGPPPPPPGSPLPAPALQAGRGCASSLQPRWDAPPIQPRPRGRVRRCLEGKPSAQGHPGRSRERDLRASSRSLEVSGNRTGRGLGTWGLACAEREGPGVRGGGARGAEAVASAPRRAPPRP